MKRLFVILASAVALYAASGLYIVRGNERAAVRRLGRAVRTPEGRVRLEGSGLHYSLPWPFAEIARIRLNEVRMLTVGVGDADEAAGGGFLKSVQTENRSQFLTGDKNILHLQINAQYRVSEDALDDFLFRSRAPEAQLERIVETVATDLISRSGVDYVHPLGQVDLNGLLTADVRKLADEQRLGIEVDEVTINAVYPPVLVKSYFLDVTSARADKVNSINEAKAYAEQRRAAARSEARRTMDQAAGYRQQVVESARAEAESFVRLIEQFRDEERSGARSYAQARQMALGRRYIDTMRDVLRSVSAKIVLDSKEPSDLTIFGRPGSKKPAVRAAPIAR